MNKFIQKPVVVSFQARMFIASYILIQLFATILNKKLYFFL